MQWPEGLDLLPPGLLPSLFRDVVAKGLNPRWFTWAFLWSLLKVVRVLGSH